MAVLMILEWQGVSVDDYERLNDRIGVHGDEDAPDGLIEHVAALTDENELVIADLWESEQALGAFFETRLGPAIRELGLPEAAPRVASVHQHRPGRASEGNVLILIDAPDATTDVYDAMAATMPSHAPGAEHPGHLHVAAADEHGLLVADLWASEDDFHRFAREEVVPAAERTQAAGIQPRALRVHNRIRGRASVTP